MENDSFIERMGGENGCRQLARDFYARVAINEGLKPLFPGKSLRCATEEFAAFLIQFLDGDQSQTSYRWWLSLSESHKRFRISDQQRMIWLSLMQEALHATVKDLSVREAMEQFFRAASVYVVGQGEAGAVEQQELSLRWKNQVELDSLISDIVHGRDDEAIARSHQFTDRTSVFVGILARMMETGRDPLIDFVLDSIQNSSVLLESRFNGKSHLHFAAKSACLRAVQSLLDLGLNPDILDTGSHTPLYRAASAHSDTEGAAVVAALARAGAKLNHCGGVSKSTALHEAARFGNIQIVQALLDAGASSEVRDRKNLTPLDRARNLKRHGVVELLTARSSAG